MRASRRSRMRTMARSSGMWPSANKRERSAPGPFVVIGNPCSERVEFFQRALARLGQPAARVVPYLELIGGRVRLQEQVPEGAVVRIESPGESFEVEKALLLAGAELCGEEGSYARATREEVEALRFDRGAILYPRQWYTGYCAVL